MKKIGIKYLTMLIDIYIFIFAALLIFIPTQSSFLLGVLLIVISLYVLNKVKFNKHLLLLFSFIAYVNISIGLADLMHVASPLAERTLKWQMDTRNSEYLIIGAKLLFIQMSSINLCLSNRYLDKIKNYNYKLEIPTRDNPLIYWIGLLTLIIFWKFGYTEALSDSYESNTRTIYEYCIIIFIFVWAYSGNSYLKKYLLYFYSVIYILQSLYRGDRSSAFPMILLILLTILPRLKLDLKRVLILGTIGIFVANAISVFRDSYSMVSFSVEYLEKYGNSLLSSDTASMSYYTSITIIKVGDLIGNGYIYFKDFVIGLFLGGGYGNANVNEIVQNYALHKNGGMFYSWFYFWFGYIGVFISSLMLGILVRKSYVGQGLYWELFRIAFIIMSFRWYLYTPFTLFRSVLVVFSILYFVCQLIDKLTRRNKPKVLKKVNRL